MGVTLVNEKITVPASWEEIKKSARSYIKDKSTSKPAKEVTFAPTAHTHTLKKTAAKAGSCLEDGNTAYWECTDCGLYFGDKDGKTPVAKGSWVIRKHLIPNCVSVIVISTALQIPSAIFTESYLSFLGLGVNAPMPSLGSLASDALNGLSSYPYRLVIPAIVISLIVLSLNLFGDGLRDAFDPKLNS